MDKTNDIFGKGSISKLLFKFSIPIILSMLIAELYSMVDTMFVGQVVGGDGIGGLVLVFPIQRIIIAFSMMIALGTSTAFSRANGRKDKEGAKKIVKNGFSFALVLMVITSITIFTFREGILRFLGASDEILPYAMDYLGIIIWGSTFLSLTLYISNIILALGDNKVAIVSNSIGAIVNIILDYILVVNVGIGVKGAAIATTTSQIAGFIYAYSKYLKARRENDLPSGIGINLSIILPILAVGVSAFIVEAEDGIVIAVLNNLLGSAVGDEGIIVLGVITKVYMFLFVTMFGMASAMQPIAAYNVGAKNYQRVKDIIRKTVIYGFVTTGILWLISMVFTPQIISIFVKEANIIEKSVDAFRVMVFAFPLVSIYYVSIFYYQSQGQARKSIILSVLRQIVIMLPVAIVLVKVLDLGAMGAWLSYPISDVISSGISFLLLRSEFKDLDRAIERENKTTKSKDIKREYVAE